MKGIALEVVLYAEKLQAKVSAMADELDALGAKRKELTQEV